LEEKRTNKKGVAMLKKGVMTALGMGAFFAMTSIALAADPSAQAEGLRAFVAIASAAGFGIAIAAAFTGLGMGYAINGALQGTARNPEAGGKIMTTMIIGLALLEALCIYALLICLILVFKIPDLGPMLDAIVRGFGA
jgi:F-type H+-transporting ATPase subunit c